MIDDVRKHGQQLVGFSDDVFDNHQGLKRFLRQNLYRHGQVSSMNEETKKVVAHLFDAYMSRPAEMTTWYAERAEGDEETRARAVADYISGMTDRFALAEHDRLI